MRNNNITNPHIYIERNTNIFYLPDNLSTDTVIFSLRSYFFKSACRHLNIVISCWDFKDFIYQSFNNIYRV